MKDAVSTLSPDLQQMFGKDSLNAFLYADDTFLVGVLQQKAAHGYVYKVGVR